MKTPKTPNTQSLLFQRIGFNHEVILFFAKQISPYALPSYRTRNYWIAGDITPSDGTYLLLAHALDRHLTLRARQIIKELETMALKQRNCENDTSGVFTFSLPLFSSNADYMQKTGENIPLCLYLVLLQRIHILTKNNIKIKLSYHLKEQKYRFFRVNFDWQGLISASKNPS